MKTDAHYYAILAFARASGFSKETSYQIAYASQFVDDAALNLIYFSGDTEKIEHDTIDDKPCFFNMATIHDYMRIHTFNYSSMISNTSAFHFVPGCRGNNFTKKLKCSEESPVIVKIIKDALKEKDPIKFGITLHAFADTFSHQGFSGLLSKVNDIIDVETESKIPWEITDQIVKFIRFFIPKKTRFDRFVDAALPAYGHAQAFEYPDLPFLTWSYRYDKSDNYANAMHHTGSINNRDRYKRAFTRIHEYLKAYISVPASCTEPGYSYEHTDRIFKTLFTLKSDRGREKNWQKFLVQEVLFSKNDKRYLTYSRFDWLEEAFKNFDEKKFGDRMVKGAVLKEDFSESYWYRFYKGVKWYKERFFKYCQKEKLDIPL